MSAFHIMTADYERDLPLLRSVREPVFVMEQSVPIELEWDELDPLSLHALALDEHGAAIGTARLTPEHKIGRMAVLPPWRGTGVGAALMTHLLEQARQLGYRAVELHAQVAAMAFYARHGFIAYGEEFDEAGIRHRHMRRSL